ncbi:hypothetical protein [Myroides odoratimimus]|uniref:Uncharacterized protein n=1 Tax=Myroides odoratimimus CCUG 10230 TaxID=883150 RepID=A0ABN0E8C1_9FLAO|nr:hypothetical protein [Myroides odoratimimus]EHO07782.1 hypothetical protein HMPREF9712_02518 [Myroides odoratimimus CCUG 10230]STZ48010.1 Uncharacterised protein [Myroides odoratimimus]
MSENSTLKITNGIKSLLDQLPKVSYGNNVMPYLNIEEYGSGKDAFDSLISEFSEIDFTTITEFLDLNKEISRQKRELKKLEDKHTNLIAIIGEQTNGTEGSIANQILLSLKEEIEQLQEKRDLLDGEIIEKERQENSRIFKQKEKEKTEEIAYSKKVENLEKLYNEKESNLKESFKKTKEELDKKTQDSIHESKNKVTEAERNATGKVKLINQFRDFLEETNKNMNLYSYTIIGILIAGITGIGFSIPNLLESFSSFDKFILAQADKITSWQIINYALGLLIVKLPWALCLSALLTGMYSLLKGLLTTYEKINQDKRNMSAIYAISGDVAQQLNEYGISLIEDDEIDETDETKIIISITKKELNNKRENVRWNQIMRYFENMQQSKLEIENPEDPTKVKLLTATLNKLIDRLPKN